VSKEVRGDEIDSIICLHGGSVNEDDDATKWGG
jgi:hypothetical protein